MSTKQNVATCRHSQAMRNIGVIIRCRTTGRVLVEVNNPYAQFKFPTSQIDRPLRDVLELIHTRVGLWPKKWISRAEMWDKSTTYYFELVDSAGDNHRKDNYCWISPWDFLSPDGYTYPRYSSVDDVGYFSRMLVVNFTIRVANNLYGRRKNRNRSFQPVRKTVVSNSTIVEHKQIETVATTSVLVAKTSTLPPSIDTSPTILPVEAVPELKGVNISELNRMNSPKKDVYHVTIKNEDVKKAGAIIQCTKTGRLLMVFGKVSRMWSFPKGSVEYHTKEGRPMDFSPFGAAQREVKEEVGIDLLAPSSSVTIDQRNVVISHGSTVYFQGFCDSTLKNFKWLKPIDTAEIEMVSWIHPTTFLRTRSRTANRDVTTFMRKKFR